MKNITLLFLAVVFPVIASADELTPTYTEWHDLQVNEINRLPVHTTFFAYESEALALGRDKTKSSNYLSIDGKWRFNWVTRVGAR